MESPSNELPNRPPQLDPAVVPYAESTSTNDNTREGVTGTSTGNEGDLPTSNGTNAGATTANPFRQGVDSLPLEVPIGNPDQQPGASRMSAILVSDGMTTVLPAALPGLLTGQATAMAIACRVPVELLTYAVSNLVLVSPERWPVELATMMEVFETRRLTNMDSVIMGSGMQHNSVPPVSNLAWNGNGEGSRPGMTTRNTSDGNNSNGNNPPILLSEHDLGNDSRPDEMPPHRSAQSQYQGQSRVQRTPESGRFDGIPRNVTDDTPSRNPPSVISRTMVSLPPRMDRASLPGDRPAMIPVVDTGEVRLENGQLPAPALHPFSNKPIWPPFSDGRPVVTNSPVATGLVEPRARVIYGMSKQYCFWYISTYFIPLMGDSASKSFTSYRFDGQPYSGSRGTFEEWENRITLTKSMHGWPDAVAIMALGKQLGTDPFRVYTELAAEGKLLQMSWQQVVYALRDAFPGAVVTESDAASQLRLLKKGPNETLSAFGLRFRTLVEQARLQNNPVSTFHSWTTGLDCAWLSFHITNWIRDFESRERRSPSLVEVTGATVEYFERQLAAGNIDQSGQLVDGVGPSSTAVVPGGSRRIPLDGAVRVNNLETDKPSMDAAVLSAVVPTTADASSHVAICINALQTAGYLVAPGQSLGKPVAAGDKGASMTRPSSLICYNCNEEGHYARDCPKPDKRQDGRGRGRGRGRGGRSRGRGYYNQQWDRASEEEKKRKADQDTGPWDSKKFKSAVTDQLKQILGQDAVGNMDKGK